MHIRLTAEGPLHADEHLTLVWCGNKPASSEGDSLQDWAETIARILNRSLQTRPLITRVRAVGILNSSRVAVLEDHSRLTGMRELADNCGLNRSSYSNFIPHITAPTAALLRVVGDEVMFTHCSVVL